MYYKYVEKMYTWPGMKNVSVASNLESVMETEFDFVLYTAAGVKIFKERSISGVVL